MDLERGRYECGNTDCIGTDGWPITTKQKGRDRYCPECGWVKEGYRSPPEKGWTRVKLRKKQLFQMYPNLRARGLSIILSDLQGYLGPTGSHLMTARIPNLAGKILYTIIGMPVVAFTAGVPEAVRSYWPEVIRPLKYGSFSSNDIFLRDMNAEDFQSLFEVKK